MWKYIGVFAVLVSFAVMILTIIATHEQWSKKAIASLFCTMGGAFAITLIAFFNTAGF